MQILRNRPGSVEAEPKQRANKPRTRTASLAWKSIEKERPEIKKRVLVHTVSKNKYAVMRYVIVDDFEFWLTEGNHHKRIAPDDAWAYFKCYSYEKVHD